MIPMMIEGVRRNFTRSSVFLYTVSLLDETHSKLLTFAVERHEALPIVAALNGIVLPRPPSVQVMVDTLKLLDANLDNISIDDHSMLTPHYNTCSCTLHWRINPSQQQRMMIRPGDVLALSLLMNTPIFVADALFDRIGIILTEGQTAETIAARYLLQYEGIQLPKDKALRLGHHKTPLRNALVKEFKQAILGKEPILPEEDTEEHKHNYFTYLVGEDWREYINQSQHMDCIN